MVPELLKKQYAKNEVHNCAKYLDYYFCFLLDLFLIRVCRSWFLDESNPSFLSLIFKLFFYIHVV